MRNQARIDGVMARMWLATHHDKGVGKKNGVGVKLQMSEQCFTGCVALIKIW